ncbi:hypothetical protein ABZ070_03100 [Streptomyces sp. NPDC006283]|uniref:hypothetical protein n=1 Tax=Streptomyces sp. NPDC006283 TaxID=3156741 RepID=UPI0033B0443B
MDRRKNDFGGGCVLCEDLFSRPRNKPPVPVRAWWVQVLGTTLAAALIVTGLAAVAVTGH